MESSPPDLFARIGLRLAESAIRSPARALGVAGLLVALAAPGLARLELRTDGRALAPAGAAAVRFDAEVESHFGRKNPVAVVGRAARPDGIFDPAILAWVARISAALAELSGVQPTDVTSLATEPSLRRLPNSLLFAPLLEPLPTTPDELARLAAELTQIRLYDGTLVSRRRDAVAVFVGAPPVADRTTFLAAVREVVRASEAPPGLEVSLVGAPVAESMLGRHLLADLGVPGLDAGEAPALGMVPLVLLIMAAVFSIAFRRMAAAFLPLVEVGVCLVLVFGLMGWLGHPVFLTTAVLPVILTGVAVADDVHLLRRFLDLAPGEGRVRVAAAVRELAAPMVATSLTTAAAFLSFALSPLPPVRLFGLYAAFGVLAALLFSLGVSPALLVLLGPARLDRRGPPRATGGLAHALVALVGWAARRRAWVLAGTFALVLVAALGASRLEVQDSWVDGFSPQSEVARTTRWFDDNFLGSHLLVVALAADAPRLAGEVPAERLGELELRVPAPPGVKVAELAGSALRVFQTGGPRPREWGTWVEAARLDGEEILLTLVRWGGSPAAWLQPEVGETLGWELESRPFTEPQVLAKVAALEAFLAAQPEVGGVLGPAAYLETAAFLMQNGDESARRLPRDAREGGQTWSNYEVVRGAARRGRVLDDDGGRALIDVYLAGADYASTRRLLAAIRERERSELAAVGLRVGFAGDVAVSQALIEGVVQTQVRSLLTSLVVILLMVAWLLRSVRRGLLATVPPALAVLASFGVMGWSGIPLGVATSMFASMTLGVGVDFALHLLARHELARGRGRDHHQAMAEAAAVAGPAITLDGFAVCLGFAVLTLSQVPSNARLGGLLVASLATAYLAAFVVLPALSQRRPVRRWP